MARLTSPPSFTGTIGPVTVYRMYGQYYIRSRSSLTGKRVKTDPAFHTTMQYAAWLGKASQIGSKVYAAVLSRDKKHSLYRKLTGEAMTWLKYAWKEADIIEYLLNKYAGRQPAAEAPATRLRRSYRRSRVLRSLVRFPVTNNSAAISLLRLYANKSMALPRRNGERPMLYEQHNSREAGLASLLLSLQYNHFH